MNEITSLERRPDGGPGPIRRTALHDTLVSHLRDMIIEGDLSPGTRLHEGQLGEQLGVAAGTSKSRLFFARRALAALLGAPRAGPRAIPLEGDSR